MKPHIQILPEHEQHARELLDALNRIHELQGEIHEAKRPSLTASRSSSAAAAS
jgi:hypothetical protein